MRPEPPPINGIVVSLCCLSLLDDRIEQRARLDFDGDLMVDRRLARDVYAELFGRPWYA